MANQAQYWNRLSWGERDQPGRLIACPSEYQLYPPHRTVYPSRLAAFRSGVEEEGDRTCRGGSEKDARVCAECELGHYRRLYSHNPLLHCSSMQKLCPDGELVRNRQYPLPVGQIPACRRAGP